MVMIYSNKFENVIIYYVDIVYYSVRCRCGVEILPITPHLIIVSSFRTL